MSENKTNSKEGAFTSLKGFHRAVPIILVAVSVFIALCFITKNTGALGNFISSVLLGLFSAGGYFIPFFLLLQAFFYPSDKQKNRVLSRVITSVLAILTISVLVHSIANVGQELTFSAKEFYNNGINGIGGGFIGGTVAFALTKLIGTIGLIILAVALIALYIVFFFSSGRRAFSKVLLSVLNFLSNVFSKIKDMFVGFRKQQSINKEKRKINKLNKEQEPLFDDEFFAVDNSIKDLEIPKLGIKETRDTDSIEINPSLQNKVFHKSRFSEEYSQSESTKKTQTFERVSTNDSSYSSREEKKINLDFSTKNSSYGLANNVTESKYTPRSDDIIYQPVNDNKEEPVTEITNQKKKSSSANAESIFGNDFEPFDLKLNEELANKPSSKAESLKTEKSSEFKENIRSITQEDIDKARRNALFENRKSEVLKQRAKSELYDTKDLGFVVESGNFESVKDILSSDSSRQSNEEPVHETARVNPEFKAAPENIAEEAPQSKPYIPDYVKADNAAFGTDRPLSRTEKEATVKESFEFNNKTSNSEASVNYGDTQFKEYNSPSTSEYDSVPMKNNAQDEEITVTRSMVDDITKHRSQEPDENTDGEIEPEYTAQVSESQNGFSDDNVSAEDYRSEFADDDDEEEDGTDETLSSAEDEEYEYEPIPENEQSDVVKGYRNLYPFLDNEAEKEDDGPLYERPAQNTKAQGADYGQAVAESEDDDDYYSAEEKEDDFAERETDTDDDYDFKSTKSSVPDDTDDEDEEDYEDQTEEEPVRNQKPDYSDYVYPSVDFLVKGKVEIDENQTNEQYQNQEKLIDALEQFGVKISIKAVDRGPRITRYEIVPARGVKVSSITGLFNDIALSIGVEGIRMEAPIPGKSAIGIEIPNEKPSTVLLRDLVESDEFLRSPSKTVACLGKDVTGNPVITDIAKMPHLLVAGATGMGKSVCINAILISILFKARPDEVKLIMIDPKKVEFHPYNNIPHLLIPVVTDVKLAAGALTWAVDEMNKRYEIMEKYDVRKIDDYNTIVKENPSLGDPLPKIIIVIDELNDIMIQVKKPAEDLIMNITQKARAAGIHMIIGTQRPSVDVITGVIKANIPSRISCRVASFNDSKTIIEQSGAEKLLNNGDMLYIANGAPKAKRLQGAFVTDDEVKKVMNFLKSQSKENAYDNGVLEEITKAAQKCIKTKGGDDDDSDGDDDVSGGGYLGDSQFLDAVEVVIRQKKASTSLLQRKVGIGYGKAAKFIDIMEELGVVSEPNGQRPRDVLISKEEWMEMLARRNMD